jgi:outer membrane murein-binding lipoprotein Lpp
MNNTSGNLQQELANKESEINKLNKKIQQLEQDVVQLKREKAAEEDRREQEKVKFEKIIKDLEARIALL